jgi:hypothetical protein
MTKYPDALIAHNPRGVPVAKNMRFTENTIETKPGEGLWKAVTKIPIISAKAAVVDSLEYNRMSIMMAGHDRSSFTVAFFVILFNWSWA